MRRRARGVSREAGTELSPLIPTLRGLSSPNMTAVMPETCRLEVWRCMSGALESSVGLVERPVDLARWATVK